MTLSVRTLFEFAIIVLTMFPSTIRCQLAHQGASIDDAIEQILQDNSGVGLTAWSVNGKGHLCSLGSAGERIKNSGQPFVTTGDSRHHIGSVTKSMTSSLIAILIEDGTIPSGWDATMQELLPIAIGTNYESVTLREVVSMLAGIPDTPGNNTDIPEHDPNDIRSLRRAIAEAVLLSTPVHIPGTAFLYTNWGYVLAGHIIEELTNTTWEKALATRLFLPLGIDLGEDAAFTGAPDNEDDPWGHNGDDQIPCDPSLADNSYCDNAKFFGPAGTFSGPVAAMARYFAWHIQCHNGAFSDTDSSSSLLSQNSCQQLHQPANKSISKYGYGWTCTTRKWAKGLTCTHSGTNTLNFYSVWLAFGIDRAFSGFTNGNGRSNDTDFWMVDAAISAAILGNTDCKSRIQSAVYTESEGNTTSSVMPPVTGTSESYKIVDPSFTWRCILTMGLLLGIVY